MKIKALLGIRQPYSKALTVEYFLNNFTLNFTAICNVHSK